MAGCDDFPEVSTVPLIAVLNTEVDTPSAETEVLGMKSIVVDACAAESVLNVSCATTSVPLTPLAFGLTPMV